MKSFGTIIVGFIIMVVSLSILGVKPPHVYHVDVVQASQPTEINPPSEVSQEGWQSIQQREDKKTENSLCSGFGSFDGLPVPDVGSTVYVNTDLYHKIRKRPEWACQVTQSSAKGYSLEVAKNIFDLSYPGVIIIKINVSTSGITSKVYSLNLSTYLFTFIKKGFDQK